MATLPSEEGRKLVDNIAKQKLEQEGISETVGIALALSRQASPGFMGVSPENNGDLRPDALFLWQSLASAMMSHVISKYVISKQSRIKHLRGFKGGIR
jgi:hypothetical protein